MKEFLKKICIKDFPWIYVCAKVIKHRKDSEYLNIYLNDNSTVKLEKNNNANIEDCVCEIVVGGKAEGFFATIRWALDALYFCDKYSLKPVLKIAEDSLYFDKDMPKNLNPFEYYFKQTSNVSISQLKDVKAFIRYTERNREHAERLNNHNGYCYTDKYIEEMARIFNKYLSFNDETQEKIQKEIEKRKIQPHTLGVNIRGTDYKKNYKYHPLFIPIEQYYEHIDLAMEKYNFEKIFVATDDQDILNQMMEKYGNKIIYDKETLRGSGNEGVHTTKFDRKFHNYLLGIEVIYDMCSLAKCDAIITGLSQVGLMTRIYKKSLGQEFIFDEKLDNGINKKGKIYK